MKKSILKLAVFLAVFVLAFFIVGKIMNKDHDNLTMDLAPASLPVVSMMLDGREYNHLHGYTQAVDVAFERDTVTILGESRDTDFVIDTYGREIQEVSIEVRSADGSRLIENTVLSGLSRTGNIIQGTVALKDLIEKDTDYSLCFVLQMDGGAACFGKAGVCDRFS